MLRSEAKAMRTNVVIDDDLLAAAMKATGLRTKKAVIDEALRTLVRLKSQEQIRALRGQLHWEGDLDALRVSRHYPDIEQAEPQDAGPVALAGSAGLTHVDR
jgi:Arc/MetJ family transcription regulator